jgi:hypothetical protein
LIPITLEEQRWATRKLRNENAAVNEQAQFRAIAQRREMVEEAQKSSILSDFSPMTSSCH